MPVLELERVSEPVQALGKVQDLVLVQGPVQVLEVEKEQAQGWVPVSHGNGECPYWFAYGIQSCQCALSEPGPPTRAGSQRPTRLLQSVFDSFPP